MRTVRIHQYGGPNALRYEEVPKPKPGPGDVVIELKSIGVNYIDIYQREGLYKVALPFTPGLEGAGVIHAVGSQVDFLKRGDRVVFAMSQGAYAEIAAAPAWKVVPLPPEMDFVTGAAAMLQGLTAHYLTGSTYRLGAGQTALVHAAAGGVGLLLVQIAKLLGARVIGTVSSEAKVQPAQLAGADHVIVTTRDDFASAVKDLTGGAGVDVVYDSVGRATFERSLDCLRPRGLMALYGQSSGAVPPLDPQVLNAKGSLFLTRPSLAHYAATREEILRRSADLFGWIAAGKVRVHVGLSYPLAEAAEAHRRLESRQTVGKILLIP